MYNFKLVFLGLLISTIMACSGDDGAAAVEANPPVTQPEFTQPELTTQNPEFTSGGIRFNGTVVSEGDGYLERGFCWSYNTNPTRDNEKLTVDGSGSGPYYASVGYLGLLQTNTTLNVRAYVVSMSGEVIYGNNITFTTPDDYSLSIATVADITSSRAIFSGSISSNSFLNQVQHKGFCISTNSVPTINNATLVDIQGTALGNFSGDVSGLQANTIYYIRSFGYNNTNHVMYSDIISFRTVGYIGASGGYVFYDKGHASDNWRYLEASPVDLIVNNSYLMKWGCTGTNIFQTSTELGTGKENTQRILQFCNDANSAARVCDSYTVNGLNDWYLPSLNEMALLEDSLSSFVQIGNMTDQVYWTSSESDANNARGYNGYYGFAAGFGVSKNNTNLVRAVRRF